MRTKVSVFNLVLLFGISFLSIACNEFWAGPATQVISSDDLLGTWQADYSLYKVFNSHTFDFVSGIERLSFMPDGSYSQYFDDELVAQGKWNLDSNHVLHLHKAKILIYGEEAALEFSQNNARAFTSDCRGDRIELDGSELVLCVKQKEANDIVLQHLEVGDPDLPVYITFQRVSP